MTVTHMWSGRVGPTSFRVRARTTGATARLQVADNASFTGATFFGPIAHSLNIVTLDATGLAADTQYWYRIEDAGVIDATKVGRAHTHGTVGQPYSFTFGSASCAGHGSAYPGAAGLAPSRLSNHPVFDEVRVHDPLFFIHSGDFHYYNLGSGGFGIVGGGSLANYRTGYDDVLTHCSRQAECWRNIPIVHVWDDHEYGPNDSDGTYDSKANAAAVYREREPHYPLVNASGSIYHSFQVGRVLFAMLDSRYNRAATTTPSPRTYLGAAQLTWLEGLLTTPPAGADLLCVVSPQPMNSGGLTSWGSYTQERDDLYQMFGDTGWVGKMFMLSGDQHQFGWDSGRNTAGFPLYTLASLDATFTTAGGNYDLGARADRGQWGQISIKDYGKIFRVTVQGLTANV